MPDQHKRNLQYVPQAENLRTITQFISNGIGRSPAGQDGALIRQMMPPMISKYTDGMEYKFHLDTPFMHCNGSLRADLSMTLFLSDPESYDGGELVLVTRGERVAVVTWMQSHIGDPAKRKVIGELWRAYELIVEIKGEDSDEARRLMHVVLELTRMWAES